MPIFSETERLIAEHGAVCRALKAATGSDARALEEQERALHMRIVKSEPQDAEGMSALIEYVATCFDTTKPADNDAIDALHGVAASIHANNLEWREFRLHNLIMHTLSGDFGREVLSKRHANTMEIRSFLDDLSADLEARLAPHNLQSAHKADFQNAPTAARLAFALKADIEALMRECEIYSADIEEKQSIAAARIDAAAKSGADQAGERQTSID